MRDFAAYEAAVDVLSDACVRPSSHTQDALMLQLNVSLPNEFLTLFCFTVAFIALKVSIEPLGTNRNGDVCNSFLPLVCAHLNKYFGCTSWGHYQLIALFSAGSITFSLWLEWSI